MQKNRNGIPVQVKSSKKPQRRKPIEGMDLTMRRFQLIDNECDVIVTIPVFSPIMELMKSDGWREVHE